MRNDMKMNLPATNTLTRSPSCFHRNYCRHSAAEGIILKLQNIGGFLFCSLLLYEIFFVTSFAKDFFCQETTNA
jgi:hypothetical protein